MSSVTMSSVPSYGAAGSLPYAQPPPFGSASAYGSSSFGPAPSHGASPAFVTPSFSAPIPVTPIIVSEEALAGGGGLNGAGGFALSKFFALPLLILIPLLALPIVSIVLSSIAISKVKKNEKGSEAEDKKSAEYETTTPYYVMTNGTTEGGYPNKQSRREADSASGLPAMTIAQVEKLTQVIFNALRMQECQQRLLCELGSMSRSFSESAHSVAQAVEQFVPNSIKESYDVFAKAENCEKYKCGSLEVKK